MAWFKSTSTHIADWRAFSLTGRSMHQLAFYGLILGFVWGVIVVKSFGLPGDKERAYRALEKSRAAPTPAICIDFPKSTMCAEYKKTHKGKGGINEIQ